MVMLLRIIQPKYFHVNRARYIAEFITNNVLLICNAIGSNKRKRLYFVECHVILERKTSFYKDLKTFQCPIQFAL